MILFEQQIDKIITGLKQGEVIAYPTESVFGLGCDPDNKSAVLALLALKNRPIEKGLILVAAELSQLEPYIALHQLSAAQQQQLSASWPGAVTWLVPKSATTPDWLVGQFSCLAVRVSAHPVVQKLCQRYGKPLVSTSANRSGESPAKQAEVVEQMFNGKIQVLHGAVGGRAKPSEIRDILTGLVVRQG